MPFIRYFSIAITSVMLTLPINVKADDVNHFHGLPAKTLEEAVSNISVYNKKLEEILAGELSPTAMAQIHQLTYTLENALETLENSIDDIEDTLEKVHKGSERADTATVKAAGKQYLTEARKIIK